MKRLTTLIAAVLVLILSGTGYSGVVDDIGGLQLWLDAGSMAGLGDGDLVGQWDDLSGMDVA
ncbi:MAG: hypothetical protein ACC645_24395, partial [Pirellulales bacterium]